MARAVSFVYCESVYETHAPLSELCKWIGTSLNPIKSPVSNHEGELCRATYGTDRDCRDAWVQDWLLHLRLGPDVCWFAGSGLLPPWLVGG